MSTSRKILIGVVAAVAVGALGTYAYLLFIKDDAPAELTTSDLDNALADTTVAAAAADTTGSDTTGSDTTGATTGATTAPGNTGADGTWAISTESTLGYRVSEVLGGVDTEGAGRTNQVTGTLTIAGTQATAADFTVDMASVTSDSDRRDGQFRSRIMSTDDFPTSTFVLTSPIDFGAVPGEGDEITASATGDLTLRGVTNSVTFDVTAKLEGGRIGILGQIPVAFSAYEIPDPSNGFAVVKDNGLLEFVLVFDLA
ncbi:MAG: YceI family protein [Ilumatobacteraceae bacterium]